MLTSIRPLGVLVLGLGVGLSSAAADLPVLYLTPGAFRASPPAEVTLRVEAGPPASARTVPWPENDLAWFFVRDGGTQTNLVTLPPSDRTGRSAATRVAHEGVSVMAFDTRPTVTLVTAREWADFLAGNVARSPAIGEKPGTAPGSSVRVRRYQSSVALVRVAPPDAAATPSGVAMSKRGQKAEIRLLVDPTMPIVGGDLPLKVYVRGESRPGVLVQATCLATGKTEKKTTNPSGVTHFRITSPGVWRLQFHDVRPAADPDADWELFSSTMTFEVPPKGAVK